MYDETPLQTLYIRVYRRGAVFHWDCNRLYRDSLFRYGEAATAVILYASLSFPEVLVSSLSPGTCERFELSDGFFLPGESESFFYFLNLVGHSLAKCPCHRTRNSVWQLLFAFSDCPGALP
jgi:hypothetical protein